ncbi:MAG: hypothetical protein Q8L27_00340 [archaeon]|nr:hypothetical protein [archaeon]
MIDWVSVGLIVIALAWVVQLILSWNSKKIQPAFILLYMLGVIVLLASGYIAKLPVSPYEIFTLIAALVVLIRVLLLKK